MTIITQINLEQVYAKNSKKQNEQRSKLCQNETAKTVM